MNTIISDSSLSTEIPPSQSFTKDEIDAQCVAIGLYPSPPNRSRIVRALNIYRAGAVHCIQNGNGHQIYAVQSQSDSTQFYHVQGKDIAHLECECPDTLNGFDCKHLFAVRLARAAAETAEKEREIAEFEADCGCACDMEDGNRAAHLAEAASPYQTAKSRINQEAPISYNRPDSLTRRGDVLIARFGYGMNWKADDAIADWQEVIRAMFPTATVVKTTADRRNQIRCYFSLAESPSLYQTAKARFNETTTRSAARPDSLTRRNGTLIAAKFYGQYDKRMIAEWWSDSIRELFPDATIHKTTVCPRWYTVRCYFSL